MNKNIGLTNDKLKIIAVITMLIDHIGAYLFPTVMWLRIIGRVAFPIFAFMIAEGCRYTRNKKRYLLNMATLALVCQLMFSRFDNTVFLRIPFTFTLSVVVIYVFRYFEEAFTTDSTIAKKIISALMLMVAVSGVYYLNMIFTIDYGFYGCMTPVVISMADSQVFVSDRQRNNLNTKLVCLAVMLVLISNSSIYLQYYCLAAVPLLAMYNGKRENIVPKNFFYIFYPLHLAVIYAIKYLK